MAGNESKRKRSVPDWMKSPKKPSPIKSTDNKGNVSIGGRTQRPSYPQISIKKTKQLPKPMEGREPETDASGQAAGPSHINEFEPFIDDPNSSRPCNSNMANVSSAIKVTAKELDAFVMTVQDLTRVAEEVIREEHQKNTKLLLSGTSRKKAPS